MMTKPIRALVALALALASAGAGNVAAAPAEALRQRLNLNRDWRFELGDHPGAQAPAFDDSSWDAVGLPHSFSIPYFASPDFYVGYGWYRRHFVVPPSYAGKRLFVEFEGAFQDAEVFVNGTPVGRHQGGYTGFSLDVTAAARAGDNLLAVRLNNLWNPRLAPRAGEHVFSGGLYRDVWLVVTDPLHVPWYGSFVRTPKVSKEGATVSVDTEVRNDGAAAKRAVVDTAVLDAAGQVVARMRSSQDVPAGRTVTVTQVGETIASPKLWSPQAPNLYTVHTVISDGSRPVDAFDSPLGIRSIAFTPDKGFFLNGEHYYFRGANAHQDHAGWGDAVTNAGAARDVKMVKDAGFDFIRGSHYPHDPSFADACDRDGVLLWSENAFWGIGGFKPDGYWNASAYPPNPEDQPGFEASVLQQLGEMIRIFRNHPSVVVWSMSNEPFFTAPGTIAPMRGLLEKEVALAHRLDPTRPAAVGGAQRPLDDKDRIDRVGDVAGYNGDGASIAAFQEPGVASVVSEYGSTTAVRPGAYDPGWGDLAKTGATDGKPWRSGQAIWCAFDHGSLAGAQLGRMGIVDYFRIPKRAWHWYRNAYAHVPPPAWPRPGTPARLRLEADRTEGEGVGTDGTDDVKLTVTVLGGGGEPISNSPPVELAVASGPGEFPTGPSIRFEEKSDIAIRDGRAAIEFRSYYAGRTVVRATSPGLEAAEVTVRFEGPVPYVEGKTPPARPRPYVRFDRKGQPNAPQPFGRDNPTFASSAAPGHAAGLATDGDGKTWWQPAEGDGSPSLTLDVEKGLLIAQVRLEFPESGVYRYRVDASDDQKTWKPLADLTGNSTKESRRVLAAPPGTTGRFVRITFVAPADAAAAPARVSEIEVTGVIRN